MVLQVAGWRYPRDTILEGNALKMEIARVACQHCPTCRARVETVESRLNRANVPWRWETRDTGLYLVVERPSSNGRVDNYLSGLLGLSIREF